MTDETPRHDGCAGCAARGNCRQDTALDPRCLTVVERRLWLEHYKRHLEERLAEVNRQLTEL